MSITSGVQRNSQASAASAPEGLEPEASGWARRYRQDLVIFDAIAAASAIVVSFALRFGVHDSALEGWSASIPAELYTLGLVGVWLLVMACSGTYNAATIGAGSREYERVINGGVWFLALIAITAFAFKLDLARGFIAVLLPAVILFTVVGRWTARRWLHRKRLDGRCSRATVVIGNPLFAYRLVRHLERVPQAGYRVVGLCIDGPSDIVVGGRAIPVLGPSEQVLDIVSGVGAEVVALAGELPFDDVSVRRLSWQLEGTGVELVVAPTMVDVAGPRVTVRPVAGLPLLKVEDPQFTGARRLAKTIGDRVAGGVLFALASPLMLLIAFAIKVSSRGPVLFRQQRVGIGGTSFSMLKFRTMVADAEEQLDQLRDRNELDGPLFKLRADPRCTPVGRFLRRFSLDELPQLWHVLTGRMSLVGPRPPLPAEVASYGPDVARRLLVKPGLTGLWQVSGRADLSWDESVDLDLYYVEHWSLALDAAILGKTVVAVFRGRGAY